MSRLYLLLLLFPFCAGAQKWGKDTSLIYLDENLEISNAKNAAFAGVSIKVDGGWMVYAHYPDTTPLLKAYYKDKALKIKTGPYVAYYPKGIKAKEGFYADNKMNSNWQFWYSTGQLKDSGRVIDDYLVGTWKSWHPNGVVMAEANYKEAVLTNNISLLQQVALPQTTPPYAYFKDGRYTSWYRNGKIESSGSFLNNKMEGTWQWYHPNGAPATEETFADGALVNLQCFDTTGRPTDNLCSIEKPALLKHYGDYRTFIFENLTWPDEARKKRIQGDVRVQLTVTKAGKLENLSITAEAPLLQKAVEQLFEQMKEWYPAISHNREVDWHDEVIIPFRLNNNEATYDILLKGKTNISTE